MAERRTGIPVTITEYLGDEPQPGLVRFTFADAHGRTWTFVDKTPVVSTEDLDARSTYPRPGTLPCRILSRHADASGRELAQVAIDILLDADDDLLIEVFAEALVETAD